MTDDKGKNQEVALENEENQVMDGTTENQNLEDKYQLTEEELNMPIFEGGPTRREVEEWKEKHGEVFFTPFSDNEIYIWRTIKRDEYADIIRNSNLTPLTREEEIVEKCVLYPRNLTKEKIRKSKAGIASLLSEQIMEKSGFVAESGPIKL